MSTKTVPLEILFPDQNVEDDDRMDFLYAAFPANQKLNPKQYSNKMTLWKHCISNFCNAKNSSILRYNDIHAVKFKGKSSLALGKCWECLAREKKLLPVSDFKAYLQQSWTSWALNKTLVDPLKWMGSSIFSSGDESGWKNESFVFVDCFLTKTNMISQILSKKLQNGLESLLIPYFNLFELCVDFLPAEEEFELALLYLQSKKILAVHVLEDGTKIVKFTGKPGWSIPKVSKTELAKIDLEKSLQAVQDNISRVNKRLEEVTKEAVLYGKQGDKRRAIRCLKRKRIMEKDLDQKFAMESNLENLLSKLEDSHSLNLVINAMKSSSEVMKDRAITTQELDNTMDDIEEALAQDQSLHDAMASMGQRFAENQGIFDADLEAELEELAGASEESPMRDAKTANGKMSTVKRKAGSVSSDPDELYSSAENDSGIDSRKAGLSEINGASNGFHGIAHSDESPASKMRRATETRSAMMAA